jgi:AcrR family transcriptional regulator
MAVKSPHKDGARRQARAGRILDTATALILRWGYNKTTIDDIARQAGVAKGTIYLHWKTREELFQALLQRERLEYARDFQRCLLADPEGITLRSMTKHSALALARRPLLKAVLMSDMEVLGKLASREQKNPAYVERLAGFKVYLELLRQYGAARTDLSLQAEVHIWSAVFSGFFVGAPLMPDEFAVPDEEPVQCTLGTGRRVSAKASRLIDQTFREYIERGIAAVERQFQEEIER